MTIKNITVDMWELVIELINEGWQFDLVYTDINSAGSKECEEIKGMRWEADFTRRKENNLWDNHESGVSKDDPNVAIKEAYDNIRSGRRLKMPVEQDGMELMEDKKSQ